MIITIIVEDFFSKVKKEDLQLAIILIVVLLSTIFAIYYFKRKTVKIEENADSASIEGLNTI